MTVAGACRARRSVATLVAAAIAAAVLAAAGAVAAATPAACVCGTAASRTSSVPTPLVV